MFFTARVLMKRRARKELYIMRYVAALVAVVVISANVAVWVVWPWSLLSWLVGGATVYLILMVGALRFLALNRRYPPPSTHL